MDAFAQALMAIARRTGTRIGVAVDAGFDFTPYRESLMKAGLPVFATMERALLGLVKLAE